MELIKTAIRVRFNWTSSWPRWTRCDAVGEIDQTAATPLSRIDTFLLTTRSNQRPTKLIGAGYCVRTRIRSARMPHNINASSIMIIISRVLHRPTFPVTLCV
jgi:hypothetical protein